MPGMDAGDGQLMAGQAIAAAAVGHNLRASLRIPGQAAQRFHDGVILDFPATVIVRQAMLAAGHPG